MLKGLCLSLVLVVACVIGSGCKPAADSGACAKDTDCKGDRVCASGACVDHAGAASPKPAVAAPTVTAPAAGSGSSGGPPSALVGDSDACAVGVANFYRVLAATGTPDEKAYYAPEADSLANCRKEQWPVGLMECARTMTATDQWQSKCWKAAFTGELDLKPKRTFDAFEYAAGKYANVSPPAMMGDGDWMGGSDGCGSMMKVNGPASASFIVCNGSVVAGPLTTVAEIRAIHAERAKQSADAFELGRRIRANWPSGCSSCKYKIYDQNGNYLRTE